MWVFDLNANNGKKHTNVTKDTSSNNNVSLCARQNNKRNKANLGQPLAL